jgi:hypothetical protein
MRNIKSVLFAVISILLASTLFGCDEGLRIMEREIGSVPDKLIYVQYVDKELDFSGGTVLYHIKQGTVSEKDMTETRIDEAVDFNKPGKYTVKIDDYYGQKSDMQFEVTVIPIDDADWLDPEVAEEAKRIANFDTSIDQDKIKEIINKYLDDHYKEYLAKTISGIEQNKDDYPTYDELIKTYKSLTYDSYHVYRNFEIAGDKAVVRMTEDTVYMEGHKPYMYSHSRRIFTLQKNDGTWEIVSDEYQSRS